MRAKGIPSMQLNLLQHESTMSVDSDASSPPFCLIENQDGSSAFSKSPAALPSPVLLTCPRFDSPHGLEQESHFGYQQVSPPMANVPFNVASTNAHKLTQLFVQWFVHSDSQGRLFSVMDDLDTAKLLDFSSVCVFKRSSRMVRSLSERPHMVFGSLHGAAHKYYKARPRFHLFRLILSQKEFGVLDMFSRFYVSVKLIDKKAIQSSETTNELFSMDIGDATNHFFFANKHARQESKSDIDSLKNAEVLFTKRGDNALILFPKQQHSLKNFLPGSDTGPLTEFCLVSSFKNTSNSLNRRAFADHNATNNTSDKSLCMQQQPMNRISSLVRTDESFEYTLWNSRNLAGWASKDQHVKRFSKFAQSGQKTNYNAVSKSLRVRKDRLVLNNSFGSNQKCQWSLPARPWSILASQPFEVPMKKSIPDFYFPCGRNSRYREQNERETMKRIFQAKSARSNNPKLSLEELSEIVVSVMGLPSYLTGMVFNLAMKLSAHNGTEGLISSSGFSEHKVQRRGKEPKRDLAVGARELQISPCLRNKAYNSNCNYSQVFSDATSVDSKVTRDDTRSVDKVEYSSCSIQPVPCNKMSEVETDKDVELVSDLQILAFYEARCAGYSREARLFNILLGSNTERNYLVPNDLMPLMCNFLLRHQSLAFLRGTPEFQLRYSETVIERIYFECSREHSGRLWLTDLKRSKLLETLLVVDDLEDIDNERRFFSYAHFYVLYYKFCELDTNHDLQLDMNDLMRYGNYSLTTHIVSRIFFCHTRPLNAFDDGGYMSYSNFVRFCLCEEDKTRNASIDYWFRCIDLDGDGVITLFEMEYFYKEQLLRMSNLGHKPVQLKDMFRQMVEMIDLKTQSVSITSMDLKRCGLAGDFYNNLFNLNKSFAVGGRDLSRIRQKHATPNWTDWDRFAALEYRRLRAEKKKRQKKKVLRSGCRA